MAWSWSQTQSVSHKKQIVVLVFIFSQIEDDFFSQSLYKWSSHQWILNLWHNSLTRSMLVSYKMDCVFSGRLQYIYLALLLNIVGRWVFGIFRWLSSTAFWVFWHIVVASRSMVVLKIVLSIPSIWIAPAHLVDQIIFAGWYLLDDIWRIIFGGSDHTYICWLLRFWLRVAEPAWHCDFLIGNVQFHVDDTIKFNL